jgi:hypothetical protein
MEGRKTKYRVHDVVGIFYGGMKVIGEGNVKILELGC